MAGMMVVPVSDSRTAFNFSFCDGVRLNNAWVQPFFLFLPARMSVPIFVLHASHLPETGNHSLSPKQLPGAPTTGLAGRLFGMRPRLCVRKMFKI